MVWPIIRGVDCGRLHHKEVGCASQRMMALADPPLANRFLGFESKYSGFGVDLAQRRSIYKWKGAEHKHVEPCSANPQEGANLPESFPLGSESNAILGCSKLWAV